MSESLDNFSGLRVVALESRRADDMARLIQRSGGVALVSPSMREVPLEDPGDVVEFARELIDGNVDIVIAMTGVGMRHLVEQAEPHVGREPLLQALTNVTLVARGPKPVAVLKKWGVTPDYRVEEPNTWRELLELLDQNVQLEGQRVALQEYGVTNPSLIAGLEARGARVRRVQVYRWDFPDDTEPLTRNIRRMIDGEVDVVLFTAANQVSNLFAMAESQGVGEALSAAMERVVIGSIGPTTSEALRSRELSVDLVPEHPKMGHLVSEASHRAKELLDRKRRLAIRLATPDATVEGASTPPWYDSAFMRACRREPTDYTPVWLMRQAGRYMSEYREVRAKTTFLELCKNPQLCAEIMLTAVERLGVDAAIIFSDLLPILEPMGLDLEFAQGEGPLIHNPVRESSDVDRVIELDSVDALDFVMETVRLTRAQLPSDIPLIGFAGAPFTLASYAIEGGSSRTFLHTKTLMYRDEGAWHALLERLSRSVTRYLNAQIAAGAQVVQLFDSWVGCLGPADYRRYVLPHTQAIFAALPPDVPAIHFAAGNPALLPPVVEAGGQVIGIDWRIDLDVAWKTVGYDRAVQGNLDPLVLLADTKEIRHRAAQVLDQAANRPGHIFNLGHGVTKQTPVENAIALIDAVHEISRERRDS